MFRSKENNASNLFGSIARSYGDALVISRIERLNNESDDGSQETELSLGKDRVSIRFMRNGHPAAAWTLTADGEKFDRLTP